MKKIMRCNKCEEYTMKQTCSCGEKTVIPRPAKYSPNDKYAKYRRIAKKDEMEDK
ncbi:RNA-protein complex protein Nop10 [Candidatus Woesearchaeota archaeon]|nr:RNA-protein complex protein Nop10 [Candidatus Woesearchaeota archaeon]